MNPRINFDSRNISTIEILWRWAIPLLVLTWLTLVWMRTGHTPASSAGDDVWFGEEAYWLLKDGVLRSDWHQDIIHSEIHAYYPPFPSLVTALSFKLFGLTQFSFGLPVSFLLTLLIALLIRLVWKSKGLYYSIPIIFLIFCLPDVSRALFRLRYEPLIAVCMVLAFGNATRTDAKTIPSREWFWAGLWASLAGISYFHVAWLVSTVGVIATYFINEENRRERMVWYCAGAAIPLIGLAIWIFPDYMHFVAVMRQMGTSYTQDGHFRLTPTICAAIALSAWLALRIALWIRHPHDRGRVVVATIFLAAGVFEIYQQIKFPNLIVVCVLFLFFSYCAIPILDRDRSLTGNYRAGISLLCAFGAITLAAYSGRIGMNRDYAPFGLALRERLNSSGLVVTCGTGWLALREIVPAGKLIHLLYPYKNMGPAAFNVSTVLTSQQNDKISTLIVHEDMMDGVRQYLPAVTRFMNEPGVCGPYHVGKIEPYVATIYVRPKPGKPCEP